MGVKVDYLLGLCVQYDRILNEVFHETGMEGRESALNERFIGDSPEFQKTIERLHKHIEKQDKWLRQRKEEVTTLIQAITECKKRKEFYKKKAAEKVEKFRTVKPRRHPEDDPSLPYNW